MRNKNKRPTTEELVQELLDFHHDQSSARLAHFARLLKNLGLCEVCGRTDDICERNKWTTPK